jgi:hypothetical protein
VGQLNSKSFKETVKLEYLLVKNDKKFILTKCKMTSACSLMVLQCMISLPFITAINQLNILSWHHLGIIIRESEDDQDCIVDRRFQLIGHVNSVLCTFGKLDPITNNNLILEFYFSFYGSVMRNLQHPEI